MGYNICPAKKLKPNTSACKARLGCGLCGCAARPAPRASHRQAHARHTKERSRRKPHTTPHTQREKQKYRWGACPPSVLLLARAKRAPPLYVCVVWCVVFYVSVLLCGARVLDDVRREAQAGQRTRKARSQVLPCKPRYSA